VLLGRIARMPINQLVMMKMLLNQSVMAQGLHTTQEESVGGGPVVTAHHVPETEAPGVGHDRDAAAGEPRRARRGPSARGRG